MAPAKQAKIEKPTKLNQKPSKKLSLFSSSEFVIVFPFVSESGIDSFDILYTCPSKIILFDSESNWALISINLLFE